VPAARMFGVPAVLSSQRAHRDLTPGLTRHLLRLTDGMVDAVVVNSRAVRDQLVAEDRVPPHRIRLCYNGIDTVRFGAGRCAHSGLVIGVVCAFRREKDLPTLLEAFAAVRTIRPGLKLLLVGGGPAGDEIRKRACDLALGDDCTFEPATTDVPRWLRTIDIFVLPSLSEALSNSLMEAMACGCCVVASRTGGNHELVEHERTGMLFRPGDPGDLAKCLRLLIEHDFLRERLAAAGAAYIHENFSISAAARTMGDIYLEFLERAVL
jgi:glycosyltransferase involved in cell wall biosynthesis